MQEGKREVGIYAYNQSYVAVVDPEEAHAMEYGVQTNKQTNKKKKKKKKRQKEMKIKKKWPKPGVG